MPFEMDYTDVGGANHPNSYWVIRYLSLNDPNEDALLTFHGYHDAASFFAGGGEIGLHVYNVNDNPTYEEYFAQAKYLTSFQMPYFQVLEAMATVLDDFFISASTFSYLKPSSIEIGSQGPDRVVVVFPAPVDLMVMGNLTSGVTIKVNGVDATISAASQNGLQTEIYYDLTAPVDANDVVTWEYDGLGFLTDSSVIALHCFPAEAVTNNVGSYLKLNVPSNSIHIAHIL